MGLYVYGVPAPVSIEALNPVLLTYKNIVVLICIWFLFVTRMEAKILIEFDQQTQTVRILDASKGKVIYEKFPGLGYWISPQQSNLCDRSDQRKTLQPEVLIDVVKDGINLSYTFHNSGIENTSIGEFYIGKFNLDSTVYWRNTNYTFGEEALHAKRNILFLSQANIYPSTSAYSPVTVFRDEDYIVGVSVMYPFMEYKHTINQLLAGTFYDNLPSGWEVVIQANAPCNSQKYQPSGDIKPGETRVYKIALRVKEVENAAQDWKEVIHPYKEYFNEHYGQLQYHRDGRPIIGYHGVSNHLQTNDNPSGYWNVEDVTGEQQHPLRPDKNGYGPTTEYLEKMLAANHCRRIMLWAPTGLYFKHPERNYPFQFTSQWSAHTIDSLSGNTRSLLEDTPVQLKRLSRNGTTLGLWWGHSTYVTEDWDSDMYEMFDPANSKHWNLSFKELDGALAAGADMIGLDSYNDLPAWDQVTWLDSMRVRSGNNVKFIAEQYSFDVVHTRAAFFYAKWNITGRHVLADYLLPGNEKWIFLIPDQMEDLGAYAKQAARWGYNACKMTYLGAPFHKLYKSKR